jgi:signal transduction histidine kinase
MRLKFLFVLIILYVLAGFGWWSYSLIEFSNNEFKLKSQLLKSERQTCELKVVEEARSSKFISDLADTFQINRVDIIVDTLLVKKYVLKTFSGRYRIIFNNSLKMKTASVEIDQSTNNILVKELQLKKRSFAIEAILLTLLIAAGIFGVYFSVSFVFDLNKQQNNFLLSVTHELKTPIAAIKLIGETMMRRTLPKEKQEELMGNILENANRLQDMTENMLTAMQMENNRYNVRKEEINLSNIVEEVKANFSLKNAIVGNVEKNIQFYADPVLIKMILNNLIENAIKYSDNQPVEINLFNRKEEIILEVKDQGIGIDPSYKKKIFKKFYRIQDEETRETKGSGLGLFIVKQAVEKHKGKIAVSDNEPKGTVFTITLQGIS